MSDETLPPEDDWSPGDADADELGGSWSWLDDAVDAWDHLDGAEEPGEQAARGEAADDTPGPDRSGEDDEVDTPPGDEPGPAAADGSRDGGGPPPVDLPFPEDGVDDAAEDAEDADDESADDAGASGVLAADGPAPTCSAAALAEAFTLAGLEDADQVLSVIGTGQVDARVAVGALDFAGVDARVEYAGLGELIERLAAGDEILLGGGEPHALVSIDPAAGEVVMEPLAGGPRTVLAVELFEEAWEETANELMVLNADNPGIQLGTGEVCVIPVAVSDIS